MKLMTPQVFVRSETGAPALARGLAVLTALGARSPLSLEVLSADLSLPKASVFRLLGALQEIGLVRKNSEKGYEALCVLRALADEPSQYRERIEKKLPEICRAAGATAEWYEPATEGMRLISQNLPDTEVRVQARPGFVRRWSEEFDAVARLGYAFDSQAPEPERLRQYVSDGVKEKVSRKDAQSRVADARRENSASDLHYNTNGVRRCAVAAVENGVFRGVIAVAEAYHFSRSKRKGRYLDLLKRALLEI